MTPINDVGANRNSQKASVVLGYSQANYQTTSAATNENMRICKSAEAGNTRSWENKNKLCSIHLGDDKRGFIPTSKQQDPTNQLHNYTAKLNVEAKRLLTRTSASLGTEKTSYDTTSGAATRWNKDSMQDAIAFRDEIRKRTGPRESHTLNRDETTQYISESKSIFIDNFKSFQPSKMAESVKNDLRATHYSLGHFKLDYSTTSHIPALSKDVYAQYAKRMPPVHDPRKASIEIS